MIQENVVYMRIDDADLIKKFTFGEGLWDEIAEPSINKDTWEPVIDEHTHWVAFFHQEEIDGVLEKTKLVGLACIHPRTTLMAECHIGIHKSNRALYGYTVALTLLLYVLTETFYWKLVAQAPACYKHIQPFVESIGFELEGKLTESVIRDEHIYDTLIFGINRPKMVQTLEKFLEANDI